MLRAAAECAHRVAAQLTQRIKFFNSGAARFAADLGMERGGVITQFAHVTQHHHAPAAGLPCITLGQYADRGAHRGGVGVVSVVDQCRAMPCGLALQASRYTAEFLQSCGNGFQRHTQRDRGGACRQCVACVMRTGHL